MSSGDFFGIVLIAGSVLTGLFLLAGSRKRTAANVLSDLSVSFSDTIRDSEEDEDAAPRKKQTAGMFADRGLLAAGLIDAGDRRRFVLRRKITPLAFVVAALLVRIVFFPSDISGVIKVALLALAAGYLFERARFAGLKRLYKLKLEFYLPLVMERMVMAVQAGLDIIPAIAAIIGDAAETPERRRKSEDSDPVSELLGIVYKMVQSGVSFEASLNQVASAVDCSSLKHAFIHLGLAHKEGGEIVAPLKELSDSTQLYFQESVEEDIAKMPVKATMPLLCTFAGLIICFITSPLIQVIGITAKAMPK